VSVISTTWGSTTLRVAVQASQCIKRDPISKITNAKRLAEWLKR
jgi:hypothetical protein